MSANANIRAGRAYVEVTAETSKLKKNLDAAQSQLKSFGKTCQGLGRDMMALGGAPGVHSARYAGEGGNDGRNLRKLLANLEGVTDRQARFVTVVALALPDGTVRTAEGTVNGTIIHEARGTGGFGYDPAFVPDGYDKTFAELPAETKNALSHRANALKNAVAQGLFSF